jgi:hypothetical protein
MTIVSKIKNMLHEAWYQRKRKTLRGNIRKCYGQSTDPEVQAVLDYLDAHPELPMPLSMNPPYEWPKDYRAEDIEVVKDDARDLLYIVFRDHRVYFPRRESPESIREAVRTGLMEQDARSPHTYVAGSFDIERGDVGVFIGASDGLFCLSRLERLSKAYLFEPAAHWHEPLKATFESLADKVEVVPLAVTARSGEGQISLDDFFEGKAPPNFIQVDVDGADWPVLQGARRTIENARKLRLALCTYHKRLDFPKFSSFLKDRGYTVGHSPGFFLIGVRMPYLRRGVLHANRLHPNREADF